MTTSTQTASEVIPLPAPEPGAGVYEPHLAVDPANPERMAVGAQWGTKNGHGRWFYVWLTEDGGKTWFHRRKTQPEHDPALDDGYDPFFAYTVEGTVLFFGDCTPADFAEWQERKLWTRSTIPPFEELLADAMGEADMGTWRIGFSRSEDGGRTWTGGTMPSSTGGSDKCSVAIDRTPGNPHYGNVYAVWATYLSNELCISTSTDDGRSFGEPVTIPCPGTPSPYQVVVRPDGSVHVVWFLLSAAVGGDPAAEGATAIYHVSSTDGGRTFSDPRVVAHHAGPGTGAIPSFAVDGHGRMLFVWGQATDVVDQEARPLRQSRHRLVGIRSEDGVSWTGPDELAPWVPSEKHCGLPTITSDGNEWWIVCYLADDEQTEVVFLRSQDGARFEQDRTLATRKIPLDEIRLWGSALMLYCGDVAHIGDYIGCAGTPDRVAAVFILPETDEPLSTATAYVALAQPS
jgi:hypothetical protein